MEKRAAKENRAAADDEIVPAKIRRVPAEIRRWSKVELGALKRAVALHGRDWAAVASSVGSKTIMQCKNKVAVEVAAGGAASAAQRQRLRAG